MKTVKKNVYYCDHCKKKSLSKHAIRKHEVGCTANAKRSCRTCYGESGIDLTTFVPILKERYRLIEVDIPICEGSEYTYPETKVEWIGEPFTLEELREMTDNCPSCLLAVMRQAGLCRYYFKEKFGSFDFKEELKLYPRKEEPFRYYAE